MDLFTHSYVGPGMNSMNRGQVHTGKGHQNRHRDNASIAGYADNSRKGYASTSSLCCKIPVSRNSDVTTGIPQSTAARHWVTSSSHDITTSLSSNFFGDDATYCRDTVRCELCQLRRISNKDNIYNEKQD